MNNALALALAAAWFAYRRRHVSRLQYEYLGLRDTLGLADVREKARIRRYLLGFGVALVALLVVCSGAESRDVATRKQAWTSRATDLGRTRTQLQSRISRIREHEPATFDEYVKQCVDLEPLLDENDVLSQKSKQFFVEGVHLFKGDVQSQEMLATMSLIQEKEQEFAQLLRQEISAAKSISQFPPSKQRDYYRAVVLPLLDKEAEVSRQELNLMRQAQLQGVKFPPGVADQLKQ